MIKTYFLNTESALINYKKELKTMKEFNIPFVILDRKPKIVKIYANKRR